MTTPITKEWLQQTIEDIEDVLKTNISGKNDSDAVNMLTALKMALTAKGAEPIYQVWDDGKWCDYEERFWRELYDEHSANMFRIVYTAPPAPVVNAEPVAWIVHARTGDQLTTDGCYVANAEGILGLHSTPLYAAAPSLTVPDEIIASGSMDIGKQCYSDDMNKNRIAMLKGDK